MSGLTVGDLRRELEGEPDYVRVRVLAWVDPEPDPEDKPALLVITRVEIDKGANHVVLEAENV